MKLMVTIFVLAGALFISEAAQAGDAWDIISGIYDKIIPNAEAPTLPDPTPTPSPSPSPSPSLSERHQSQYLQRYLQRVSYEPGVVFQGMRQVLPRPQCPLIEDVFRPCR